MISSFIGISIYKAQDDINKLKRLNEQLETANKELQIKIDKEVKESQKKIINYLSSSKISFNG